MKVIVPVDDRNGMMFNNRRLSQDKLLRQYLLILCKEKALFMNEYSQKQFLNEKEARLFVDPSFLTIAGAEDFCFVENEYLMPHLTKIDTVYLCKWNRRYPADFYLDLQLVPTFICTKITDIVGFSHEKITIEEWKENEKK